MERLEITGNAPRAWGSNDAPNLYSSVLKSSNSKARAYPDGGCQGAWTTEIDGSEA
ncbi:hypothetical protein PSCICO_17500 [Pseudomonas cichorii]|jgi:hypothetical protein|nr:hypothetical protein PSCICO_17500 [Pseudomonas cichorii]